MLSWNFNTFGAWSSAPVINSKKLAYTIYLDFSGKNFLSRAFVDVFDPAWNDSIVSIAKSLCGPARNDPYLLGYYSDNEVPSQD